ncbi:ABC-type glycerol-3-phosphate transport system substrate-binding protein [Arthrobacter sp. AG258]|uniref:ABC transporter substrate-binding protein n=1 Tax=Arthrobacter sp. AG258 TaxID=2183899 RepID=UPI00105C1EC7|nr:extracellular solute-binding protein [Arthrobacter sp. AG258]TDT74658.1 ABC-type glycerol-3-phosphate transport system substrate-binding protein [Arthrobacter sp. AG258]
MRAMKLTSAVAVAGALALGATGCAGSSGTPAPSAAGPATDSAKCEQITVLTNRTDIVDTTLAGYAKKFAAGNPGKTVKFQAITDYDNEVKTRMNTKDYGDVLLIPAAVSPKQFNQFFTPLGATDELAKSYRFVTQGAAGGQVYGIPQTGNVGGYAINKKVWEAAGITTPPTTPEEFLASLEKIKGSTQAVPLYTNYKDGWPLTQVETFTGIVDGPDASNILAEDKEPWAQGKEHYLADSILFKAVQQDLTESDPTTTNWENSKTLIGSGKVGAMFLGSWSVTQLREAAVKAGGAAADIDYWPLPVQKDGKYRSVASGDYRVAINKNSSCQETSRKWLDFFLGESGYATEQGGLSPKLDGPEPDTLATFKKLGVEYVELNPAPEGKEALLSDVQKAAEITFTDPTYRQKLVDIARGAAPGTMDSYFSELNKRWADGISTAGL